MIFDPSPQIPLSLSEREVEYLIELLTEEKEVLEPFYDHVDWAQERIDIIDALIERLSREI